MNHFTFFALAAALGQIGAVLPIVLTLAGPVLHVYEARHRMTLEEHVKDQRLSETEARRRIRFYEICAVLVTVLGLAVLGLTIYRHVE